ncbi:MAG: hypothetical protein ACLFST_00270 [Spirochaetia bacterium]
MPSIRDFILQVKKIYYWSGCPVEHTVAGELKAKSLSEDKITKAETLEPEENTLILGIMSDKRLWQELKIPVNDQDEHWTYCRYYGRRLELYASKEHLLYGLGYWAANEGQRIPLEEAENGILRKTAFPVLRPVYDSFLNQYARSVEDFDKEAYIREYAISGCSHIEANGLAYHVPFERGPKGELLHRFYTYCPALDQFTASFLNKGIYDSDYLQANMNHLKENAALAGKYGLRAGLLCFEPRSVPDELLERFPHLRGARVDHPIRSFKPRYNLSTAHPVVLEHYGEMVQNLLNEVPELDYLSIWSNDSGAGFEYTDSLYVGRNGGGYVTREWKGDEAITEAAGKNIVRFMKTLRDSGRTVNPRFRVTLRFEPFAKEQVYIWEELGDGFGVEAASLLAKGWESAYAHPVYPDMEKTYTNDIIDTALFNSFSPEERKYIDDLEQKGSSADFYFNPGSFWNHEPLLGIPFPRLVHEKLSAVHAQGVKNFAIAGGTSQRDWVPYDINRETIRHFQFDPDLNFDRFLIKQAGEWIGQDMAADLVTLWELFDQSFRFYPIPVKIYSTWSVWYRLLIRPLIPDIEAVPEAERKYYEEFLLATSHNRNRIDLRYDVGFELTTVNRADAAVGGMEENLFPSLDRIGNHLEGMKQKASREHEKKAVRDSKERYRAVACWYRNQYNTARWIAGVHGYLEAQEEKDREKRLQQLKDMMKDEIRNTRELIDLIENAESKIMIFSEKGETTFIYYRNNFTGQLRQKIRLTELHMDDLPRIDPDFQWRVPGL